MNMNPDEDNLYEFVIEAVDKVSKKRIRKIYDQIHFALDNYHNEFDHAHLCQYLLTMMNELEKELEE